MSIELWEEPEVSNTTDFETFNHPHPLERLFKMGEALLSMPTGQVEIVSMINTDGKKLQKRIPHLTLSTVQLVVRAPGLGHDSYQWRPYQIECGVITRGNEEMYIGLERGISNKGPADKPYDIALTSYFDSHFAALAQQAQPQD